MLPFLRLAWVVGLFACLCAFTLAGTRVVGNTVISETNDGGCGFVNSVAGTGMCVGPAVRWTQNQSGDMATASYVVSATPELLASVSVNGVVALTKYGGQVLPAHAFTVLWIDVALRAAGIDGGTPAVFQIASGANTCDCSFSCSSAVGNYAPTCSGSGGAGCAFAGGASLDYKFVSVGDCVSSPDVLGNIGVEGNWQ